MGSDLRGSVGECRPEEAWERLAADPAAVLVDVRTRPEWSFVGIPDLSRIGREAILLEWRKYPDMAVNAGFADALLDALGGNMPPAIFFLCRSGARSLEAAGEVAARMAAQGQDVVCVNVEEGFEGVLDDARHRGRLNGWKAAGLPWKQS
jgi:rhodanese-related sulfurtransferase